MTEEQNKLADELDAEVKNERSGKIANLMMRASAALREREPATEAVRLTDEEIIAAWNGAVPESKDKGIEMYLHLMRAVADAQYCKLSALKGKGASQGAEGVGLTVHEADIIAAAVQLVPLLEEGWDEYDAPEDQSEGARACDALIKAVNAMLQAPDEQKG